MPREKTGKLGIKERGLRNGEEGGNGVDERNGKERLRIHRFQNRGLSYLIIIIIVVVIIIVVANNVMKRDWQIAAVKAYDGEREKLGNAEQFYAHLLQLPAYRLRVQLMLFRSEMFTGCTWVHVYFV